jgi:hypothetical protein
MSIRESRVALRRPDAEPHPALVSATAIVAAPTVPPVPEIRVQIKFRVARDLRLRLRLAAATMERTQDEILAEALAGWLEEHHSEQ